jgi:hypothetical protein
MNAIWRTSTKKPATPVTPAFFLHNFGGPGTQRKVNPCALNHIENIHKGIGMSREKGKKVQLKSDPF